MLMSVVAPDEPEGYRGRRRHFRFPFARKAGGAAVPALLVAASVVVVLIVVGVSQLLPKQAAGQIPFGSGPGSVSDNNDNGQGNNPADAGTIPSAGRSTKPGKSGGPKASPGAPGSPQVAPTDTTTPTGPPSPTPTFSPLTVQAEAATLAGGAYSSTTGCSACLGGAKVRNVGKTSATVNGSVSVNVNTPAGGNFKITISYEVSGTRELFVDVNGGSTKSLSCTGTTWGSPVSGTVTVALKVGANTVRFYNSTAAAPDLDAIKVEQV